MSVTRTIEAGRVVVPASLLVLMSQEDRARYSPTGLSAPSIANPTLDVTEKPSQADVRAEKTLQEEFERWLLLHQYLHYRVPMHRRSTLPAGYPDFTVWLGAGRILWIEYKTETGSLSPDQIGYRRQLHERGHSVFVSRSLRFSIDCLRAVEGAGVREASL